MTPDLEVIPRGIPSMGGAELAPQLRTLARSARSGTAIVEVGSWTGAGAAQLPLGILERGSHDEVRLYAFERWHTSKAEPRRVDAGGVAVAGDEDLLPTVKRTSQPLGVPIEHRKGELRGVT